MNIGVDLRCLMSKNLAGVGEYAQELLSAVFKIDKENQYFLFFNSSTKISHDLQKWKQDNVQYIHTHWPNKLFNLCEMFFHRPRLDKLVYKYAGKKMDMFFSPNFNFTSLSSGVKRILTIHDLSFEFFPECFTRKQKYWHKLLGPKQQAKKADLILVPSFSTKHDVVGYYGIDEQKVHVLYHGLCSHIVDSSSSTDEVVKKKYCLPEKYILFLGTIEPRKNIISLVQAYDQGQWLKDGYELIIAGGIGWRHEQILDCIKNTKGARYIGYVEDAEKKSLYSLAGLFVFPSLYEGFGLPVLEAMACGVPVITSNRSSLTEVVSNAGYFVNPRDLSEIKRAIRLLLADDELRKLLIARGFGQNRKFVWEDTAKKFLDLIMI